MKLNEMKHFYDNNEDSLRSKLTNHEFSFSSSAWDDMAKRLDKAQNAKGGAAGWWKWAWLSMGIVAIGSVGIGWGMYASSTPQISSTDLAITPAIAQANNQTAKQHITKENNTTPALAVKHNTTTPATLAAANNNAGTTAPAASPVKMSKANTVRPVYKNTNKPEIAAETPVSKEVIKTNNNIENIDNNAENANPSRITRISYQYSTSNLYRLRMDSLADSKIRQQHRDVDSSLFQLDRVRDKWQSAWEMGMMGGVTAKRYASGQNAASAFVGVFTRWNANAKHAIEIGLQYKHLPHTPKNAAKASYETQFDNSSMMTTVASVRDFHLLELPIAYRFSPHRKHHLLVGVKGSWMAGVRTNTPVLASINNKKPLGISAFDASSFFGYEFSLCEHLALGFQYNLGFTNWTKKAANQYPQNMQDNGFNASDAPNELQMNTSNVPTAVEPQKVINVPRSIRNNDLQIFVKYTF